MPVIAAITRINEEERVFYLIVQHLIMSKSISTNEILNLMKEILWMTEDESEKTIRESSEAICQVNMRNRSNLAGMV